MNPFFCPVPLEKAYRLINHGPTVLVSARHQGVDNVMPAAWACALDFAPPRLTVVLDKKTSTRALVEGSGRFAIQVPTVAQLDMVWKAGQCSQAQRPDKLAYCGIKLLPLPELDVPLVEDCAAWLVCRLLPEPHNQQVYDLFIGEVTAAWADSRVFREGQWLFDQADPAWRSLHHIAGGRFHATGEALQAGQNPEPD